MLTRSKYHGCSQSLDCLKIIKFLENIFIVNSKIDIACTKLQTVGMRGEQKDFVDIYFLLEIFSLKDLFKALEEKYPEIGFSTTHILKSLVYFEDAEDQPMPKMHKEADWKTIKAKLIDSVKRIFSLRNLVKYLSKISPLRYLE